MWHTSIQIFSLLHTYTLQYWISSRLYSFIWIIIATQSIVCISFRFNMPLFILFTMVYITHTFKQHIICIYRSFCISIHTVYIYGMCAYHSTDYILYYEWRSMTKLSSSTPTIAHISILFYSIRIGCDVGVVCVCVWTRIILHKNDAGHIWCTLV